MGFFNIWCSFFNYIRHFLGRNINLISWGNVVWSSGNPDIVWVTHLKRSSTRKRFREREWCEWLDKYLVQNLVLLLLRTAKGGRPPVQNCKFISQGFHLTDRSHFGQALQMTRLADWERHNPIAWEGSQSEHQEVKIVWTFLYWKQHYLRVGHEFIFGFGSAHRRV